jgi:hypothetical protein
VDDMGTNNTLQNFSLTDKIWNVEIFMEKMTINRDSSIIADSFGGIC